MSYRPDPSDRLLRESYEEGGFRFTGPIRLIILIVILVSLVIIGWFFFFSNNESYNKTDIPLIRMDEAPHKIKAEDQGVPAVKHQDKLVYGRIREDKNLSTVEHILPDPEPPLSQIKNGEETIKMVDQYQPEDLDIEKSAVITEAPSKITSIEDLIEEDVVIKKPTVDKKVGKESTYIQLGSLKSYDIAESEWARISKKHTDIFGNLKPTIQKVDLGAEKGIYYRLRTGPFDSKEAGTKACSTLKERKVECLVVR